MLQDMLARAAHLYARHPAAIDGEVRLTYGELDARVHRLAAALQGLGLEFGDHVAILAFNSYRYMEAYLATPLAGLVLAPINTRLAPPETSFILNDGNIKALLVGRQFLPLLKEIRRELKTVEHVVLLDDGAEGELLGYEELLARADPAGLRERDWGEQDMAMLCYTGGTTGLPKGVMLSQRNLVSNAMHVIQLAEFNERDVWVHCCPMFHMADLWSCYSLTVLGAVHIFMENFEPRELLSLVQEHKVTALIMVPTMINMVLEHPECGDFDLSSLRRVIYGASPMPVERLKAAFELFGPILQQGYGQTETSPFLTCMTLRGTKLEGTEAEVRRLASCGQAIVGVDVRVVDGEGKPVKPGEVGEIVARGPNVMLGYWNRPEETAQALRDGWVHTGDMATVDEENFIFILDRAKDMIITGGENVFSPEVENALYRHPAVLEAAVIGIPDAEWGEAVKAVVVLRPGQKVSEEALIAHCREWIAHYKCPKTVDFVDSLPKSGPGKILKSELRKPFWAGQQRMVN